MTDFGHIKGEEVNFYVGLVMCKALGIRYVFKISADVYVFSMDVVLQAVEDMKATGKKYAGLPWESPWYPSEDLSKVSTAAGDLFVCEIDAGVEAFRVVWEDPSESNEAKIFNSFGRKNILWTQLKGYYQHIVHSHTFQEKCTYLRKYGYDFLNNVTEEDFNRIE